jgi:hypothetical protein
MAAVIHAAEVLADCLAEGKPQEYGARIAAHPLCDPSFRPALEALRRWSNEDIARLTRFAPRLLDVRPGVSTERAYLGTLAKTVLLNLGKMGDVRTIVHALGVSRQYSW